MIAGSGWSKQGTPFASSADFGAWVSSMLPDVTVYTVAVGVGGFHRAHMALYSDDVAACGSDWGIHGVGLLDGDRRMADVL